jgi:hypothetical protein
MKRLAAVLAAALLVTGCFHDDDCTGTVTVDWSGGFQDFDGGALLNCAEAGVREVDIWVNGAFDSTYACGVGAARGVLFDGPNVVTVEGIDAGGFITFRGEVAVNGGSCREQRLGVTLAEGTVDLDYAFSPVDSCSSPPGSTFMFFSIFDEIAGLVAAEVNATNFTNDQVCGNAEGVPLPITLLLPAGSYTLDWIREVAPPSTVLARDCTPTSFSVAGAAVTTVSPVLVDSSFSCF